MAKIFSIRDLAKDAWFQFNEKVEQPIIADLEKRRADGEELPKHWAEPGATDDERLRKERFEKFCEWFFNKPDQGGTPPTFTAE